MITAILTIILLTTSLTALGGETTLVYRVTDSVYTEGVTQDTGVQKITEAADVNMDELIAALRKRIDPKGTLKITIRERGPKLVEIIVPETVNAEKLESLKRKVTSLGTLEFRITAGRAVGSFHEQVIKIAEGSPDRRVFIVDKESGDEEIVGWWIPVTAGREEDFKKGNFVTRQGKEDEKEVLEVLVVSDPYALQGKYLQKAWAGFDGFSDTVHFAFNDEGATRFGSLTGANLKRQLGIILDGHIYAAPVIQSRIFGEGQITGGFTQQETEDLAAVLNSGLLPAVLEPVPDGE